MNQMLVNFQKHRNDLINYINVTNLSARSKKKILDLIEKIDEIFQEIYQNNGI